MPATQKRFWMTTHWPLPLRENDEHQRNIYLQEGHEDVAREMHVDDRVLIYESLTGRIEIETLADGQTRAVPRHRGRGGIVTIAEVNSPLYRRAPQVAIATFTDGEVMNWAWKADTRDHVSTGFVSMQEISKVLGYGPGYTYRGFGDRNSGLKKLDADQFDELTRQFLANDVRDAPASGGQEPPPGHWTEGGGEGAEHLLLKKYVAANASRILAEPDVTCFRIEYPFPSGDRADIILRDSAGRFIGVEIEIEQTDIQLEGTLQAIKYRHMVAFMEGRRFDETRSLLVAYRISERIKQLCTRYDVQFVEVAREDVREWKESPSAGAMM